MTQVIIIVGAARSGTKYLRDILSAAPNAVKVPYDINYIWRFHSENHPDDALPPELLTENKAEFIRSNIFRLAGSHGDSSHVLFEKTVGTTLRLPFAYAVFPDAKFVHLIRDGRAVTESAMRMWQEPPNWGKLLEKFRGIPLANLGYAFWFLGNFLSGIFSGRGGGKIWGPRYPGIEDDIAGKLNLVRICAKQWHASVDLALEGLKMVPAAQQIQIRYDQLVSGSEKLEEVARFCGLTDIDEIIGTHIARVDSKADNKWQTALSDQQKIQMSELLAPMLQQLGYREHETKS